MLVILYDSYTADRFHSMMDYCGVISIPGSLRELLTNYSYSYPIYTISSPILCDLSSHSGFGIITKNMP